MWPGRITEPSRVYLSPQAAFMMILCMRPAADKRAFVFFFLLLYTEKPIFVDVIYAAHVALH